MLFYQNTINNSDAIENKETNIDKIVYLDSTGNKDIKKYVRNQSSPFVKSTFLNTNFSYKSFKQR